MSKPLSFKTVGFYFLFSYLSIGIFNCAIITITVTINIITVKIKVTISTNLKMLLINFASGFCDTWCFNNKYTMNNNPIVIAIFIGLLGILFSRNNIVSSKVRQLYHEYFTT